MGKRNLYQAIIRRAKKYDNSKLVLVRSLKRRSGMASVRLFFAIDIETDI